jgi:hypothetical protein
MRKTVCSLMFVTVLWFTGCADNAATLHTAQLPRPSERELLAADEQRFAAMSTPDVEQLQSLLDDGVIYTDSNALVQSKAELLDSVRSGGLAYKKIRIESAHARPFPWGGIVTGTVRIVMNNNRQVEMLDRYTAVLLNGDGHLKLIAYQSSRVNQ